MCHSSQRVINPSEHTWQTLNKERRSTEKIKRKIMITVIDQRIWCNYRQLSSMGGHAPLGQVPGTIVSWVPVPRSYNVDVPSGEIRRYRSHLCERNTAVCKARAEVSSSWSELQRIQTRSQTGSALQPPLHYKIWTFYDQFKGRWSMTVWLIMM